MAWSVPIDLDRGRGLAERDSSVRQSAIAGVPSGSFVAWRGPYPSISIAIAAAGRD